MYVHTPSGADNVQFAPVPALYASQLPQIAYNITVSPCVVVRLLTLWPLLYVALVAVLLVDQPRNFLVPLVNPLAVNALDSSYVWLLLAVVPVPPLALYATVYVFTGHDVALVAWFK